MLMKKKRTPVLDEKPALEHFGKLGMHWGVITEGKKAGGATKGTEPAAPKKPSAHRLALEAKGIQKGYTPEQAAAFADKRIKGEKIALGILAGATLAAGAYVAQREYGRYFCGVSLEAGKEFHYVNALGIVQLLIDGFIRLSKRATSRSIEDISRNNIYAQDCGEGV